MKPHDQFAKNYLEQLLSPLGIVEISKEVSDETRQIDLFFSPNPEPKPDYLGLLGRIVLNTVLIEPYRNPPNRSEIRNCLANFWRFYPNCKDKLNGKIRATIMKIMPLVCGFYPLPLVSLF